MSGETGKMVVCCPGVSSGKLLSITILDWPLLAVLTARCGGWSKLFSIAKVQVYRQIMAFLPMVSLVSRFQQSSPHKEIEGD